MNKTAITKYNLEGAHNSLKFIYIIKIFKYNTYIIIYANIR